MKTVNLLFGTILSTCISFSSLFAADGVSYKGVSIMRGGHKIEHGCDWTQNCVYAVNHNTYDVIVKFDYKLDSQESPWKHCTRLDIYSTEPLVLPPSSREYMYVSGSHIPAGYSNYTQLICFDDHEIKALRITYVDIRKPKPTGEDIMKILFGSPNGAQ